MITPKVRRIGHIAIQTGDLETAMHFYVNLLGAEVITRRRFKQRNMAWLQVGGVQIELYGVRDGEALDAWTDFKPGPVHVAFVVDDLDTFLHHVREKGAEFHPSHPQPFIPPVPGASRIAYLLGPDGEEVEIRSD